LLLLLRVQAVHSADETMGHQAAAADILLQRSPGIWLAKVIGLLPGSARNGSLGDGIYFNPK
jgi:hypothetical protein